MINKKVVSLVKNKPVAPNDALVKALENALESAKKGDVLSGCIALQYADNGFEYYYEFDPRVHCSGLLGASQQMQFSMNEHIRDYFQDSEE